MYFLKLFRCYRLESPYKWDKSPKLMELFFFWSNVDGTYLLIFVNKKTFCFSDASLFISLIDQTLVLFCFCISS